MYRRNNKEVNVQYLHTQCTTSTLLVCMQLKRILIPIHIRTYRILRVSCCRQCKELGRGRDVPEGSMLLCQLSGGVARDACKKN